MGLGGDVATEDYQFQNKQVCIPGSFDRDLFSSLSLLTLLKSRLDVGTVVQTVQEYRRFRAACQSGHHIRGGQPELRIKDVESTTPVRYVLLESDRV